MEIISIVLGALFFGFTLWGVIKAYDRYNPRNTLPVALIIGSVFAVMAPVFGLFLLVLPLVALCYLLINYYELGLLSSLFVLGAMIISNVAHAELMAAITARL